MKTKYSLLAKM